MRRFADDRSETISLKALESVASTIFTEDFASVVSEVAVVSAVSEGTVCSAEVSATVVSDVSEGSVGTVSSVSEGSVSAVVTEVSETLAASDSEVSAMVSSITVSEDPVSDISSAITATVGNIPWSTSTAERTPAEILLAIFFCIVIFSSLLDFCLWFRLLDEQKKRASFLKLFSCSVVLLFLREISL